MQDVTRLLISIEQGDPHASTELLPLVYEELRSLAARKLAHEPPGQTLQATALVHEAYLKLVGSGHRQDWRDRRHFYGAAAEAMRRILVDNARKKKSVKWGGSFQQQPLGDLASPQGSTALEDILAINEALEKLGSTDPQKAELVKLRFFAGLTLPEISELLDISRATASRHWTYARAWLFNEIFGDHESPNS